MAAGPPSAHELVPPGHLAHFVRDTVREALDLSAIPAAFDEERGYPPYHPGMMVALLLYAYCRGVYSSRQIARACEERVDFMAVTGLRRPDFRTVAAFRRRHLAALADLFGLSFVFPALGFGGVLSARRIASSRRRSTSSGERASFSGVSPIGRS